MARILFAVFLLVNALAIANHANASDGHVREIQRILWMTGHYTGALDGRSGPSTKGAIRKLLVAEKADLSLSGEPLMALLKRKESEIIAEQKAKNFGPGLIARAKFDSPSNLFVFPEANLLVAGKCGNIQRFRLDNLKPLGSVNYNACGGILGVLPRRGAILEAYSDGMLFADPSRSYVFDNNRFAVSLFSPFGIATPSEREVLYSGSVTREVRRLDLETGQDRLLGRHRNGLHVTAIATNAKGDIAATGAGYPSKIPETIVWNLARKSALRRYRASLMTLSDDGRLVAVWTELKSDKERIDIYDVKTGKRVARLTTDGLLVPQNDANTAVAAAFLDQGRSLGFFRENGRFDIWELSSGNTRSITIPTTNGYESMVAIRPDLDRIFLTTLDGVAGFEISTGKPVGSVKDVATFVPIGASMTSDLRKIAVAGATAKYSDAGTVAVIEPETGKTRIAYKHSKERDITALSFLRDSDELLIGDNHGGLFRIDIATGKAVQKIQLSAEDYGHEIKQIEVSDSGDTLAVLQNHNDKMTAWILDAGTLAVKRKFSRSDDGKTGWGTDTVVAFVDGDRRLLVASWRIEAFDLATGRRVLRRNMAFFENQTSFYPVWGTYIVPTELGDGSYWIGARAIGAGQLYRYLGGRILKHYGSGKPSTSYKPGMGSQAVPIGQNRFALAYFDEIQVVNMNAETMDPINRHAANITWIGKLRDGRVATVSEDGEFHITDVASKSRLVRTKIYADGGYVAITPEGFFSGTDKAAKRLLVRGANNDVHNIDNLFQTLYRPDLVREKLAGDPKGLVRTAAGRLDLVTVLQSGSPPALTFISPTDMTTSKSDRVTVKIRLTDTGGGIGRLEWRVNGRVLGIDEAPDPTSKAERFVERVLWLDKGRNTIDAVVYNAKNLIVSNPTTLTITWAGPAEDAKPTLHVLAVAVDDYWDSRLRLKYAGSDALALAEALRQSGRELYAGVRVTSLLNQEVTRENLEEAFVTVGNQVSPRDVFVFFIAGHGKTVDGQYYFIPQDFRFKGIESIRKKGIGQEHWQKWFARVAAKKSLLLYDTCESGSLTGEGAVHRGFERVTALDRLTRAMGRSVLSAATDDAPAYEGYKGHGVFTYSILEALGRADGNGNQLIEITELAGHIDARVPEISHEAFNLRQVPQMKIVGSNFPLTGRTVIELAKSAPDTAISKVPTHVVVKSSGLFSEAAGEGTEIRKLNPGTLVTLVETTDGWALVAKDGKTLGFVPDGSLARMQ